MFRHPPFGVIPQLLGLWLQNTECVHGIDIPSIAIDNTYLAIQYDHRIPPALVLLEAYKTTTMSRNGAPLTSSTRILGMYPLDIRLSSCTSLVYLNLYPHGILVDRSL